MKWIIVDEKYLDYLRGYESRIPRTNYGSDKYKPFFGVLFEIEDLYYVTQVSHPQRRHEHMTQQKDFYKLFDPNNSNKLLAVVNLNYMFPIPKQYTQVFQNKNINQYRTFSSEDEKSKYISLLALELKAINKLNLGDKASYIYKLKYDSPDNKISKRCIDFKEMERLAKLYKSTNK